jgi:hypothetical protein
MQYLDGTQTLVNFPFQCVLRLAIIVSEVKKCILLDVADLHVITVRYCVAYESHTQCLLEEQPKPGEWL